MIKEINILLVNEINSEKGSIASKLSKTYLDSTILTADSIDKTIHILHTVKLDLIIFSIIPKGIYINEVLHLVKQNTNSIPVIVLTDSIDDRIASEASSYNRCRLVAKGSFVQLLYTIKTELAELEMRDRYRSLQKKCKKLGRAVNNEKRNYQYFMNAVPICMLIMDERLIIKRANEMAGKTFNRKIGSILGRRLGTALGCTNSYEHPSGCGHGENCRFCHISNMINKVFQTGEAIYSIEIQQEVLVDNLNRSYWFSVSIMPVAAEGEKLVTVALSDVTDYIMVEEKLLHSRDFYLTLFEEFPALIWRSGVDGKCDYFNKTWLDFTGRPLELELGDGWSKSVHPEDLDGCIKSYYGNFRAKRPFQLEYRLRRCDGEYRWIVDTGRPYYDLDGKFAGYIGACYDITERRQAEEGLRRYQVLSEKARDKILFMEMDGRIIEANEAAVRAYGYKKQELLTMSIFDLRRSKEDVKKQMLVAKKEGIFLETTHYRKDGSSFPAEVNAQGTEIGGKDVLISIIRDITGRKRIEKELQEAKETAEAASRAKSEFLSNMSHEIRTPLNGITGMLDMTMLTELTEKQKENLSIAKSCTNTLLKVINDVLDFSKIEAGKMTLENIQFDIRQLVERIFKTHNIFAVQKGIKLRNTIDDSIPVLLSGDPGRLGQVINNLLGNAVKFTDFGEVVLKVEKIRHEGDKTVLSFTISDTGIGMTREEMDRLFKSFSQVDGSITRKYGGTGLGLSISKRLIGMMGGDICAESRKGHGSIFVFTAMFGSKADGAAAEESGFKCRLDKAARVLDILLVEDDHINQVVTGQMLSEKGHRVSIANNGMEGLSMATRNRYDVILMDIQMPEMDGLKATELLREFEREKGINTPIIALTAYAFRDDRERFIAAGMDGFIAKPIQMNELFAVIEKADKISCSPENSHLQSRNTVVNYSLVNADTGNGINRDFYIDLHPKCTLLKEALEVGNTVMAESIASSIKSAALENNETEVKNTAFKLLLAVRRKALGEAAELCRELEGKIYL